MNRITSRREDNHEHSVHTRHMPRHRGGNVLASASDRIRDDSRGACVVADAVSAAAIVAQRFAQMSPNRRMRLWALVVERTHGGTVSVDQAAAVAIDVAGVDAAAVTVVLPASPREIVYASSRLAGDAEDLTTTVGEGPGVDALSDGPALVDDLSSPWCQVRWPVFAPEALNAGIHAVFALPLQIGGAHLGVMDLYRKHPGPLQTEQLADVLLLADTACALLLDASTPGGGTHPADTGLQHPEVHQATGMIIAQVGVTAAVALIRLRAYAYANDQRLRDVAANVVARRLRFHPDTHTGDA